MKKTISLVCIFLLCGIFRVSGQKMPSDYFDEGLSYFEEGKNEKAIAAFKYITDNHPHNPLYPEAFYNIGYVYYYDKQYDSAMVIFRKILVSNFNEKQEIGGDIMSDPYANYKHRASLFISNIYYDQKQYDSALYYFSLSDTLYPYEHFCGNEMAENEIYTALRYADIYEKLGKPDEAIKVLLPQVFNTDLADNSKLLDKLKELITNQKIKNPKKQLEDAIQNMYVKKVQYKDGTSYSYYCFNYLGAEIRTPDGYDVEGKFDKSLTMKNIRESAFYKMINELEK